MYVLETLFQSALCKRSFLKAYKPVTKRLSVFAQIEAEYEASKANNAQSSSEASESELSEIEMSPEVF